MLPEDLRSGPPAAGASDPAESQPSTGLVVRVPAIALVLLGGLALRLVIAYVLLPGQGLGNDLRLFSHWALVLASNGPAHFYATAGFADYPPGYLYVLWRSEERRVGKEGTYGGWAAGRID